VAREAPVAARAFAAGDVAYANGHAADGVLGPMLAARQAANAAKTALKDRYARETDPRKRAALARALVDDARRLARSPRSDVDALAVADLLVNLPYLLPKFALPHDDFADGATRLAAINGVAFEH
jgi:hypothetical protein